MDDRWRTQHDAVPWQQHAPYGEPPRPARDPNAAAIYHQLAQANAEIARLRGIVASTQSDADRRFAHLQHQVLSRSNAEKADLIAKLNELQSKNRELQQSHQAERDHRISRENDLAGEVDSLKKELANMASAALAEQQTLRDHHALQSQRHQALLAERDQQIHHQERLVKDVESRAVAFRQQLESADQRRAAWESAHESSVDLADWLVQQCQKLSRDLSSSENAYDQLHDEAMRLLQQRDNRLRKLSDTVSVLQTDHEAVELANADLDHLNDRLQCELDELTKEFDNVQVGAKREQQQLVQATQSVSDQLARTNLKLESLSREKQALLEAIEQRRDIEDQFDASLFAKEQEISASKRAADDARRQLDQLRREHAVSVGQNDQLRSQVREQDKELAELKQRLDDANEQLDQAVELADQRDQQFRQLQTATRAAEANATLQQHETAREYAMEIDRLESLIEKYECESRAAAHDKDTVVTAVADSVVIDERQIAERVRSETSRLEQDLIATRERYHHANLIEQRRRESLEEQLQRYIADNSSLTIRLREADIERQQLQFRLKTFDGFEKPVAEAKRLSRELARHQAESAAEREALYDRIEALHQARARIAA
ncbi:hypothetical protein [Rhodopirellula sp. MGV]|uniref:hypothetical protein n=1 Tax=Rhodopirellula sp. MGV TaxID=2023130 RepID=UPI000B9718AB|nr:hypothetical protein [Rhodopirellula sp. MGV]OYP34974.1 hypothetical protein CGZ80_13225 [Rhodopirellula sp. MGV]PNY38130.1 hypothetical protein C2E31_03720 [Rhodopirellula baltica]